MHHLEKTKIGSARKHATSRPNLLEVPADHKVFVKRRCNFVPARRHPVDQLDGGRQLDPEGSREKCCISGKNAAFRKNPEKTAQNLAKFSIMLANFAKFL